MTKKKAKHARCTAEDSQAQRKVLFHLKICFDEVDAPRGLRELRALVKYIQANKSIPIARPFAAVLSHALQQQLELPVDSYDVVDLLSVDDDDNDA